MRKITGTERTVKDLLFLQKLPKEQLAPGVIKRIEVQGTGELIKEIKIPCSIYLSFHKYDYEGRFYSQLLNVCIRDINKRGSQEIPRGVYLAVESMRLEEKAWVNLKTPELHGITGLPHGGCHFYISIEDIRYKCSQNFESKKIVSQKCREEGKKCFEAKDYEKALKQYKRQINITEGVQKKKYKKEQLEELQKINDRAKKNMLRCFAKLHTFDDNLSELAQKYSKQLLKKESGTLVMLLRCHVLKKRKYLSDALKLAEELAKQDEKEAAPLIEQLKQLIKSKK